MEKAKTDTGELQRKLEEALKSKFELESQL
jgi:hypothetical protein